MPYDDGDDNYSDIFIKLDESIIYCRKKVLKSGDTAFKKTITKKDFNSLLYTALKSYATLTDPTLKIKNDSIRLFFSVSIPVTDVGIGVAIQFDKKGNFTLEK